MKNDAALSVVLAPGGTAMFCVTQAGWAKASEAREATDISVPPRTDNEWVISAPDVDGSFWLVLTQSMAAGSHAVKRGGRITTIAAMLKPDRGPLFRA